MILLQCNGISKSFGTRLILDQIQFFIQERERVGLIGANGSGKTTLFRILTGQDSPDTGSIWRNPGLRIGYLSQHADLAAGRSVWDEAVSEYSDLQEMEQRLRQLEIEISRAHESDSVTLLSEYAHLTEQFNRRDGFAYASYTRGVLSGLGFSAADYDLPVHNLSGGQKTRLALGKLLLSKPDLLLLDEPTNHLDIAATEWLEAYLQDYRGSVLVISHDRFFLDRIVQRVLELENSQMEDYPGHYSYFVEEKARRLAERIALWEAQQKETARLEALVDQFFRWRNYSQRDSKLKVLERMQRVDDPQTHTRQAGIRFAPIRPSGKDVLIVENLGKSFDNTPLFKDLTLSLFRGERLAILGPNGVGKSTLLRILVGELESSGGTYRFGHQTQIGYFEQEHINLNPDLSILDEVWGSFPDLTQTEVRSLLGSFLFSADDVFKPIRNLSGGERSRVALAKLTLSGSNLLILDEPTNHLDIASKEALEEALLSFGSTILFVSHDRYFIDRVATRCLEFSADGGTSYLGNYTDYIEKKMQLAALRAESSADSTPSKRQRRGPGVADPEKARQRELSKLESEIETIEARIVGLEEQLCDPEIYGNPAESRRVSKEYDEAKEQRNQLYAGWETLLESN